MRLAFREKPYDLLAVAVLGLALVPLALLAVTGAVRIALGLLFVLFLPGYALVAALFPKDGEIDWIERVALSFGLSIAVVPLLGLVLNFTPWGIRLEPILATVLLFTLGMAAIAYWRRMGLPEDGRLGLAVEIGLPAWKTYTATDKALTVALAASIVFAGGTVGYVIVTPRPGEHFTEFYILGPDGTASGYPNRLNVSEEATVVLGVVNHEFADVNYSIEVRLVTVILDADPSTPGDQTVEIANATLDVVGVSLGNGETWESPYRFAIGSSGEYKVRFLLYRGPPAGEPYSFLHLLIRVA